MKEIIEQAIIRSIEKTIPFFVDKLMERIDSNTQVSKIADIANNTKLCFGEIEMSLKDVKKRITDEQIQQLEMCEMRKSVAKE